MERYRRLSLLDVCTGSADIPAAMCRVAAAQGMNLRVVGLDVSPEVLAEAARTRSNGHITLVCGDAKALPWPDESFDVVMCCLALHHFEPDDAVRVLREMWRVSRLGIVVTDLERGYLGYAATWLVTRTLARNRVTRNDGPLSVLRAYTRSELRLLVEDAGLPDPHITRRVPFRQTMVVRKGGSAGGG